MKKSFLLFHTVAIIAEMHITIQTPSFNSSRILRDEKIVMKLRISTPTHFFLKNHMEETAKNKLKELTLIKSPTKL